MINKDEKLVAILAGFPFHHVRTAFIARARIEAGRIADARAWMENNDFEQVECAADTILTEDGREILRVHGKEWALRPAVHSARLNERMAEAIKMQAERSSREKEMETKSVAGTEALSTMSCPKCGDALQHAKVCPSCAAGKLGYSHRYTCVCGGTDLVSKEAL